MWFCVSRTVDSPTEYFKGWGKRVIVGTVLMSLPFNCSVHLTGLGGKERDELQLSLGAVWYLLPVTLSQT